MNIKFLWVVCVAAILMSMYFGFVLGESYRVIKLRSSCEIDDPSKLKSAWYELP